MKVMNYKDLNVWKNGKNLALEIYSETAFFPKSEMWGLVTQMRRAAVSIPSNIAEGFNRNQRREFQRFLYIALGSAGELETQLEISGNLGFINDVRKIYLSEKIQTETRMIRKLIGSLS